MRDAGLSFPKHYRLDETCETLNAQMNSARATAAAAVAAVRGYAVPSAQLRAIIATLNRQDEERSEP